jgi:hypothetical protein
LRLWFQILSFLLHQNNEEKMKKNLLTFMFVVALLGFGVSVASAKNSSTTGNTVTVSKKSIAAKAISKKIKTLTAKCKVHDCGIELQNLMNINDLYEAACAPNYLVGCSSQLESAVIAAGNSFQACLNEELQAKKVDQTKNRYKNKLEKNQGLEPEV